MCPGYDPKLLYIFNNRKKFATLVKTTKKNPIITLSNRRSSLQITLFRKPFSQSTIQISRSFDARNILKCSLETPPTEQINQSVIYSRLNPVFFAPFESNTFVYETLCIFLQSVEERYFKSD